MSEPKYARRIPPCPEYDVEGRQAWYENMAAEGYRLSEFGRFYVYFEPDTPKKVRYRLQPTLNRKNVGSEAIALAEEYGWKHLGDHGYFSIFKTEDPHARELNTDPQVQAIAMERLLKSVIRSHLIVFLLLLPAVLILCRYPLALFTSNTVLLNWLLVSTLAVGIWEIAAEVMHLFQLYHRLRLGESLSRGKPRRLQHPRYQTVRLITAILFFLMIAASFLNNSNRLPWEKLRWQPAEEALPFAVLTDLSPGSTYEVGSWHVEHNNEAADRTTLLCKEQMQYKQFGYLHHTDGTVSNCWYTVEYYDLRTAWLAKSLFRQLRNQEANSIFFRSRYEVLPLTELPVEQAHFYQLNHPVLLLQNGSKVLQVEFAQLDVDEHYGNYTTSFIPPTQWTAAVAASLDK